MTSPLLSGTPPGIAVAAGSPRRIRMVNQALTRIWASGLAKVPLLSAEAILAKARIKADAPSLPFPDGWEDRLARLISELATSAALTPLGQTIAHGQLVAAASTMLQMQKLWDQYPAIADIAISRPVIVVGQMRSGTTRIQRLLACDPRFQFTRFYESWTPIPSTKRRSLIDDRPWRAHMALAIAHIINPMFGRLHPTGAREPDEEIGFFNMMMMPAAFEAQWRIPRFVRHCEAMDTLSLYEMLKRILQTIAWLRGRRDDRPWIMKVPQFSEDLASLLAVFPDARLVLTARPAGDILASTQALVCNQMSLQSAAVDCLWIKQEWRRKMALREARMAATLTVHSAPRVRLEFAEVNRNWQDAMAKLYHMLAMPLTSKVVARMARYQSRATLRSQGGSASYFAII